MLSQKIIKHIGKLQQKKYRAEYGEFTIEGVKGVSEALSSDVEVDLVLIQGNLRDEDEFRQIMIQAERKEVPVEFIGRKDIGPIKTTDTFPGVLAVCTQPVVEPGDLFESGPLLVLDGIKDPGNLGTIIRTADWFGIENILLSEDCVDHFNPKVVRSSMGSLFRVRVMRAGNVVSLLRKYREKRRVISLVMDGDDLNEHESQESDIYVFGSESHGVRDELEELIDVGYTIAGRGGADSLNVAVAAAIVMSKIV